MPSKQTLALRQKSLDNLKELAQRFPLTISLATEGGLTRFKIFHETPPYVTFSGRYEVAIAYIMGFKRGYLSALDPDPGDPL